MDNLLNTLDKMLEALQALALVMDAEQQQLAAGQVNSSLLQRITEDKDSLLATLSFIDRLRSEADSRSGLQQPYAHHPALAQRWAVIQQQTGKLRDINQHSGLLLNQHLAHNQQALAVLKPWQSQKFYGPDGQARSSGFISHKA